MKMKFKLGTVLKNNLRYIVLLFFSIVLLSISQQTKHNITTNEGSENLGIELVNALYNYNSLDELSDVQSDNLLNIMNESLVYYYSIEYNRNRIQYTYYGLESGVIKPIIHRTLDGYIEFTVSIDGVDDNILRGIWYSEHQGKITGLSEATLYPFSTNQKVG